VGAYRTPSPWGGHLDVVQHAGAWPEREVRGPFHGARDADRAAGRAGFVARGIKYVLIGLLYIRISVGSGGGQADRQGALHEIATQLFGKVMLWALTVGFAAMLLLRGAPAVLTTGRQQKAGSRLLDGGWPVFYSAVCWTTVMYAAGADTGESRFYLSSERQRQRAVAGLDDIGAQTVVRANADGSRAAS
jgi:hypothetical protein